MPQAPEKKQSQEEPADQEVVEVTTTPPESPETWLAEFLWFFVGSIYFPWVHKNQGELWWDWLGFAKFLRLFVHVCTPSHGPMVDTFKSCQSLGSTPHLQGARLRARLRAVDRATAAPRWGVPRQEPRAGVEECVASDCGQLWVPGNANQLGIYGWRWSFSFDIPFPSCHSLFSSTYSNHHFPYSDGKKVGWTKKNNIYIINYHYISVVQLLGMHCTEIGLGLDGDRHRQRAPTAPRRTKFFGHGKGMAQGRGLLLQGRLPVDRVQQDSLRGRGAGWFTNAPHVLNRAAAW